LREARAHEAAHEDDLALRRYTEALTLDPTCGPCYLGLAALRARLGDPREAERVYSVALAHVPELHDALLGRARVRRSLGWREEATQDIETFSLQTVDPSALRELARWQAEDGRPPAQLATWRRILALATRQGDATLANEARTMIRALQILVRPADPASAPVDPDATRRALAAIARRAG
jgi:tetratricopeptide (TPR) repeat protein